MGKPFYVKDCALITAMGGVEPAMNLRELRERVAISPTECLFHHFCETVLTPTFDDPEFRNDFAVWAVRALRDRTLAEQLGAINPYQFEDIEQLRHQLIEVIDSRLSEINTIPWVPRGLEFLFMKAVTVVFDTGMTLTSPRDFYALVSSMTHSTIYFHFVVANRRCPANVDDFSVWLSTFGEDASKLIDAFQNVDFYFMTLPELKQELVDVTSQFAGHK